MKKNPNTIFPIHKPHPDIEKFRNKIFMYYKFLILISILLACSLPTDIRETSGILNGVVTLIEEFIPYISWVKKNSEIPGLSSVWFSVVWILIFLYLLNLIFIFPYSRASEMLAAASSSTWKGVQVGFIFVLLSWMTYSIFFERNFAVQKSNSSGHARLIESFAIDTRLGLMFLAPVIASICIFVWGGTLLYVLSYVAKLFSLNKSKEV